VVLAMSRGQRTGPPPVAHPAPASERRGLHVPDPPVVPRSAAASDDSALRTHADAHAPLVVQPPAQLLHLQLELEQAPEDELQLPPRGGIFSPEYRPHMHGELACRSALADLPSTVLG